MRKLPESCFRATLCGLVVFLVLICVGLIVIVAKYRWILWGCGYSVPSAPSVLPFFPRQIAFGSCVSNDIDADIFNNVDADVFIFLGDNIYADTYNPWIMSRFYNRLSCMKSFQDMVSRTPITLAIWDDHDYGHDNAGADYTMKYQSQKMFLDFWNIPQHSDRRRGFGVYGSYRFQSPEGSVRVILPDLRFDRDPEISVNGAYVATNGSMIGKYQWKWLEREIDESQREDNWTIIGSSTQFGHSPNGYQSWNLYPADRQKLLEMINPRKTFVISGDVHWGEISNVSGVLDITSSGLSVRDPNVLPNLNRIGHAYADYNYGLIDLVQRTASIMTIDNQIAMQVKLG